MNHISNFILNSTPPKSKINNRRAFIVSQFLEELNSEIVPPREPWKASYIAVRLARTKKKIHELEEFYSICRRYKLEGKGEFGKCFFGSLKVKK